MKKLLLLTFSLASFIVFGQGKMLTLSGTAGDYVDLGNETKRNFGSAGNNFTVEFWFYDTDGTAELLGLDNGYLTFQLTSGDLVVTISDGTDTRTFTNAVSASAWHHVALVMDDESGNELKLWLDGSRTDSVVETTWNPDLSSGQWYLGALSTSPTTPASASFDELRFWSEARTKENVLWYQQDTISFADDDTTALEGYFTFETLASNTLVDSVSNGSNGSTANATTPTSVRTTAPVPYYTIASGDLYVSGTWATGQGVPDVTNQYTKIRIKHEYDQIDVAGGDDAFNLGALMIDFAHASDADSTLKRPGSHSTINGHTSIAPVMRDLVVQGGSFHVNETITVTRSIRAVNKPGGCSWCGQGHLFIDPTGRINFTGTTISMANSRTTIRGIFDVKSSSHNFNLSNSTITIQDGGLMLTEATGSNTWNMSNASLTIYYGGGVSNTSAEASISGSPNISMRTRFSSGVDGWRHFSNPNNAGKPSNFNDDLTLDYTGTATANIFTWDASENGATTNANGWTAITDSTESAVNKPYVIYESDANFPVLNSVISFKGGLASGNHSTTCYNYYDPSADQVAQNRGWNLIANPYPGAIDISKLLNDYNGDGGADNPSEWPFAYQGVHIWDPSAGQYVAVLASGESLESHDNTTATTSGGFSFIRPFTAFWVKMSASDANSETFTLKNPHRYADRMASGNSVFHKRVNPALRLNVYDPDSSRDQVLVIFDPDATDAWDQGLEAYDLRSMNSDVPSMWIPTTQGTQSILSADLPVGVTKTYPVTIEVGEAGSHTVDYNKDHFGQYMDVWLIDSTAQKTHHLLNAPYSYFESNAGDSRTLWVAVSQSAITVPEFAPTELYVTQSDGQWQVDIGEQAQTGQIQLMDISGRVIDVKEVNGQLTSFNRPDQAGVYLLRWMRDNEAPLVAKMTTF
ncbi:LamG domain-containing protein [Phaeocystidibacter luteus]|uniref:LamG domain-containing protein n=1 Tax=Phaeocystidibacter luteus TaxID=911197 RepID=A0A6N6REN4_9FLAO|nr:LamG domain-containing protein [Phaeocystidibacter luteus]KAB2808620.1 LamG domain-containing protein [Phaeocystidibacter luteus]